jgi:hypothetical protein
MHPMTHSSWLRSVGSAVLLAAFVGTSGVANAQAPASKTDQKAAQDAQTDKRAAEAIQLLFAPSAFVKDKPFSAEAVTETVQILADGNRIVRRNVAKEYRDRSGRTRQEQTIEVPGSKSGGTRTMISVHDPVAKVDYILDPETKTSSVVDTSNSPQFNSPANSTVAAAGNKVVTQKLGSKAIEGLECTGTRTTATIPAGEIGNERPILTVTETWYSPDIEAVVQSSASDPRFGKTTYTLRNVQRGDQPAALFDTPADYTVRRQSRARAAAPEHP